MLQCVVESIGYAVLLLVAAKLLLWLRTAWINRERISLKDKWVVVTGCDSGFGQALVQRLTRQGCKVIASCLSEQGMTDLKQLNPQNLVVKQMDLSKQDQIKSFVETVEKTVQGDQLWGLVNNAGIGSGGTAELCSIGDYRFCADVNLFGPILLTKLLLPLLRKSKGRIVNVSSIAGRVACPIAGPYAVTKHGLEAFSDSLRRELHGLGVKVSIVEPGAFKTQIVNMTRLENVYKEQWNQATDDQKVAYAGYLTKIFKGAEMLEKSASKDINAVVSKMEDGLSLPKPCIRQAVGLDAMLLWIPLSIMPEAMADAVLRLLDRLV